MMSRFLLVMLLFGFGISDTLAEEKPKPKIPKPIPTKSGMPKPRIPKPKNLLPPVSISVQDGDVNHDGVVDQKDIELLFDEDEAIEFVDALHRRLSTISAAYRSDGKTEVDKVAKKVVRQFAKIVAIELRDLEKGKRFFVVYWGGRDGLSIGTKYLPADQSETIFRMHDYSQHWMPMDKYAQRATPRPGSRGAVLLSESDNTGT